MVPLKASPRSAEVSVSLLSRVVWVDKAWEEKKFTDPSFRYFNNQANKSLAAMLVTGSEKKKKVCWD